MEFEYEIVLTAKRMLGKGNALLTFSGKEIAQKTQPGQFVNISCRYFLKRPFCICSADPATGTFSIGIRQTGSGSKDILSAKTGDTFSALGPLGHGFSFEGVRKIITVGGGTGIYPLVFALSKAKENHIPSICVNGYRSREDAFFLDECSQIAGKTIYSSDNGDFGVKGTVLDAIELLSEEEIEDSCVMAVGPEIMMKKVSLWAAKKNLSCQVSLERKMACGIGICLVCVCKIKSSEEGVPFHHVRCCKEGPVMNASEVLW